MEERYKWSFWFFDGKWKMENGEWKMENGKWTRGFSR
jgi:hypothetical protein